MESDPIDALVSQNGTSLQELQQLGGWSEYEMVLRYAHLSSDHLKTAAERISKISGTFSSLLCQTAGQGYVI